jgi:hypothetical protein
MAEAHGAHTYPYLTIHARSYRDQLCICRSDGVMQKRRANLEVCRIGGPKCLSRYW